MQIAKHALEQHRRTAAAATQEVIWLLITIPVLPATAKVITLKVRYVSAAIQTAEPALVLQRLTASPAVQDLR